MGEHDNMDYMMKDNETDMSLLVEQLTAPMEEQTDENICNNADFRVQYVLRPVAQATLRDFIDMCIRNISNFPETWNLCTKAGTFNCDPISGYVSACEMWRSKKCDPGHSHDGEDCTMGMMMSQSTGLLILFSLVLIGVLIGISITVAVCLICPKMHRWANRKIRGDSYLENGKPHPSSVFHLEAMESQGSSGGLYDGHLRNRISVDRIPSTNSDDYTYIGGVRTSGAPSLTDYEGLRRNNSQQQSHKYAYLPQTVPEDRHPEIREESEHLNQNDSSAEANTNSNEEQPDYAHNYFVLEKGKDK